MTCASVTSAVVAIGNLDFCPIAQLVERCALNAQVGDSNPSRAAMLKAITLSRLTIIVRPVVYSGEQNLG